MSRRDADLGRAKATRAPRRRFIIYCEGENTEPGYLVALQRSFGRDALIELEVIPTGHPMPVAERAATRAKTEGVARGSRTRKDSFEEGDQIWAVFDRDEHPNFDEAVALCASKSVRVGRSNPCFEVWLILHEEDYHRPDDHHGVCRHLRELRPEYDPHGAKVCNWSELIARVEEAERRAARQLEQRAQQGAPHGRPSTTVGHLTAAIRAAAEAAKRR
ncbi:MAG: RloB family protein [Methylocystis sp.]